MLAQGFQRFTPLLVELDGWKAGKADGVSMQMPGNNMDTAVRKYTRGNASLQAQVISGGAAQSALAVQKTGMKVESGDHRMSTSVVDGLPVTQNYTISSKSGTVIVGLADTALFSLSYNGIEDTEALMLSKKFNWKALQKALQ